MQAGVAHLAVRDEDELDGPDFDTPRRLILRTMLSLLPQPSTAFTVAVFQS
jgi:hypothetical protein